VKITALVFLILFSIAGFFAIFFTTVGTLIIFIGVLLYALMTGLSVIGLKLLIILFLIYLLGEALEYIFIIFGARRFGASNASIIGAIVGGIIGAVIGTAFFGVGVIAGTFAGIFFGAFLVELAVKRDIVRSIKSGTGGVLGRIGSIGAKVIIAIVMFALIFLSIAKDVRKRRGFAEYHGKECLINQSLDL